MEADIAAQGCETGCKASVIRAAVKVMAWLRAATPGGATVIAAAVMTGFAAPTTPSNNRRRP